MSDATRHLIVDTNLLIYYLHPQSADTKTVRERCRVLFKSAIDARWPGLRLYVPAISVAEAVGVLDKYRHCTWAGPVLQNPALRLSSRQYRQARDGLKNATPVGEDHLAFEHAIDDVEDYVAASISGRHCSRSFREGKLAAIDLIEPRVLALVLNLAEDRAVERRVRGLTVAGYLREAFGPVCPQLQITSRNPSAKARKKPSKTSQVDGRRRMPVIEANAFEEITPAQIAAFIDYKVRDQGLKPKTANHYRSIIRRVFNWASEQHGIRLANNVNPAAKVRP